jgi:hypothetical protein
VRLCIEEFSRIFDSGVANHARISALGVPLDKIDTGIAESRPETFQTIKWV